MGGQQGNFEALNIAEDMFLQGFSLFTISIDNILGGLDHAKYERARQTLPTKVWSILNKSTDFPTKHKEITEFVKANIDDVKIQKEIMQEVNKVFSNPNLRASIEGYRQLKQKIRNSELPKQTKMGFNNLISECQKTCVDMHVITMDATTYKYVMHKLKEKNLDQGTVVQKSNNGKYLVFYRATGELKQQLKDIIHATQVRKGTLNYLRPKTYEALILAASNNIEKTATLTFENLPLELAEGMIVESEHLTNLSFVKISDSHGTYTLKCNAGETQQEKDEIYSKAMKLMTAVSYSITGAYGKYMSKKYRHHALESQAIDNALDNIEAEKNEPGYFFSCNWNKNNEINPNEYIYVDNNSVTKHYIDGTKNMLHRYEFDSIQSYSRTIELAIKETPEQKVFLSKERVDKIFNGAKNDYKHIEEEIKNNNTFRDTGNIKDTLDEIKKEIIVKRQEIVTTCDMKDPMNMAKLHDLKNKNNNIDIIENIINNKYKGILPDRNTMEKELKTALLGQEISRHVFRMRVDKNTKDIIYTEKQFLKNEIARLQKLGSFELSNNIAMSRLNGPNYKLDMCIPEAMLNEFNIEKFKNDVHKNPDKYADRFKQNELDIMNFENLQPKHIYEAQKVISNVKIHMKQMSKTPEILHKKIEMQENKRKEKQRDRHYTR